MLVVPQGVLWLPEGMGFLPICPVVTTAAVVSRGTFSGNKE